jgi:hypothetical protein
MSRLNQETTKPGMALAACAREPLAPTFMMAWADSSPAGQLSCCWKPGPVHADFRQDRMGGSLADASNTHQQNKRRFPAKRGFWLTALLCKEGRSLLWSLFLPLRWVALLSRICTRDPSRTFLSHTVDRCLQIPHLSQLLTQQEAMMISPLASEGGFHLRLSRTDWAHCHISKLASLGFPST